MIDWISFLSFLKVFAYYFTMFSSLFETFKTLLRYNMTVFKPFCKLSSCHRLVTSEKTLIGIEPIRWKIGFDIKIGNSQRFKRINEIKWEANSCFNSTTDPLLHFWNRKTGGGGNKTKEIMFIYWTSNGSYLLLYNLV